MFVEDDKWVLDSLPCACEIREHICTSTTHDLILSSRIHHTFTLLYSSSFLVPVSTDTSSIQYCSLSYISPARALHPSYNWTLAL